MRLYLHCKTGQVPNRPVYELLVVCAKGLSWLLTCCCYCLVSIEGKRRAFSSRLEKCPIHQWDVKGMEERGLVLFVGVGNDCFVTFLLLSSATVYPSVASSSCQKN